MSRLGVDRLIWILTVVFAMLNIYGAAFQARNPQYRAPCLLMLTGGVVLLGAVGTSLSEFTLDWVVALIGFAAICIAAYWNGKRCGVIHLRHHVIRIGFCILLLVGFYLF